MLYSTLGNEFAYINIGVFTSTTIGRIKFNTLEPSGIKRIFTVSHYKRVGGEPAGNPI